MDDLSPRRSHIDRSHREALQTCFSKQVLDGEDAGRRFCFEAAWMRLRKLWDQHAGLRFVLTYPSTRKAPPPVVRGGEESGASVPGVADAVRALWEGRRDSSMVVGYMFESPDADGFCSWGVDMRWTWAREVGDGGALGRELERMLEGRADTPDAPPPIQRLLRGVRQISDRSEGLVWQQSAPGPKEKRAASHCGSLRTMFAGVFASAESGPILDLERGGGYGPRYRDSSVRLEAVRGVKGLPEGVRCQVEGTGYWSDRRRPGQAVEFSLRGFLTSSNWLILRRDQLRDENGEWLWVPAPGSKGSAERSNDRSGFRFWWSEHPAGRLRSCWQRLPRSDSAGDVLVGLLRSVPRKRLPDGAARLPPPGLPAGDPCLYCVSSGPVGDVDTTPFGFCSVGSLLQDDTARPGDVTPLVFGLREDRLEGRTPPSASEVVYRSGGSYRLLEPGTLVLLAGETDASLPRGVSRLNGVHEVEILPGADAGADKVVVLRPRERGSRGLFVWVESEARGYVSWGDTDAGAVRWEPSPPPPASTANIVARLAGPGEDDPGALPSPDTLHLQGNGTPAAMAAIGEMLDSKSAPLPRPPRGAPAVVQGLGGTSRSDGGEVTHRYQQVQLWFEESDRKDGVYQVGGSGMIIGASEDRATLVSLSGVCTAIDPPGNFEDFAIALRVRPHATFRVEETVAQENGESAEPDTHGDEWGTAQARRRLRNKTKWKPTVAGWKRASRSLLPPPLPREARLPLSQWEATLSILAEDGNRYQLVPVEDVQDVLFRVYNDPSTGAMAGSASLQKIIRHAYAGIRGRDILEFLDRQALRQRMDRRLLAVTKPPRPRYPNHWWQFDFTVLGEPMRQAVNHVYRYVLVVTDIFSRYAWAFPIATRQQIKMQSGAFRNLVTQMGVLPCRMNDHRGRKGRQANCRHTVVPYLEWLFLQEGAPAILQGDNEFRSNAMEVLCKRYGVELRFSRPMTPQSNGRVERINKTYKAMQRRQMHERRTQSWVDLLMRSIARYNRTPHAVTGRAPIEVYKGRRVRLNPMLLSLTNDQTAEEREEAALDKRFSRGTSWRACPRTPGSTTGTCCVAGLGAPCCGRSSSTTCGGSRCGARPPIGSPGSRTTGPRTTASAGPCPSTRTRPCAPGSWCASAFDASRGPARPSGCSGPSTCT